jgi:hypothetical protein
LILIMVTSFLAVLVKIHYHQYHIHTTQIIQRYFSINNLLYQSSSKSRAIQIHLNASCNNAGYDPPMQPRRFVDGVIRYSFMISRPICRKADRRQNEVSASNRINKTSKSEAGVQNAKPAVSRKVCAVRRSGRTCAWKGYEKSRAGG